MTRLACATPRIGRWRRIGRYPSDHSSPATPTPIALAPDGADYADLYPLSDLHWRTIALTDEQRRILEVYDTDAYGQTLAFFGPGDDGQWFSPDDDRLALPQIPDADDAPPPLLNRHIYTGREIDPETGLYYYRARHYHPQLGRFMQRWNDPFADDNLYQYQFGQPTALTDPYGDPLPLLLIGAAVVVGGGAAYGFGWWQIHRGNAELELAEQEIYRARTPGEHMRLDRFSWPLREEHTRH